MTGKWSKEIYQTGLESLTTEELCARLRGEYDNGVTYGVGPLHQEAAKRLEKMQRDLLTERPDW